MRFNGAFKFKFITSIQGLDVKVDYCRRAIRET